ncbi:EAL domain-containing protein [Haliea sp.]|uniref:EAL domain-containing protein n=1 Tax=Haliea sp. TaxID=1932666 RepID=UPI0035284D7B
MDNWKTETDDRELERLFAEARRYPLLSAEQERDIDVSKWRAVDDLCTLFIDSEGGRRYLQDLLARIQHEPPEVANFANRDHHFLLRRELVSYLSGGEQAAAVTLLATYPFSPETEVSQQPLVTSFPVESAAFLEVLDKGLVEAHIQPLVHADGSLFGYELLGRCTHPTENLHPGKLFALAASVGREVELSRLLRRRSFEQASAAGLREPLFFNNHPAECQDMDALLGEIRDLRRRHPDLQLVFEVHEAAVTDLQMMARVRDTLRELEIKLAYDDFGAGQARLLELAEVPADFLKFDMGLIQGLTSRDSGKYRLLKALSELVHGFGIRTLVEGVEQEVEAELCRELGIHLYQGFLFARPRPITPGGQ